MRPTTNQLLELALAFVLPAIIIKPITCHIVTVSLNKQLKCEFAAWICTLGSNNVTAPLVRNEKGGQGIRGLDEDFKERAVKTRLPKS